MLARYVPNLDPGAWLRWLCADDTRAGTAWSRLATRLGAGSHFENHYVFDSLRTGLFAYFSSLAGQGRAGDVLVSSQICAAVPHALRSAGFTVRFVDIDSSYPTPGAREYANALDQRTVGIVVAPLYGHIQSEWGSVLQVIGDRILVLDLAQGIGITRPIELLCRRADAVAYSFGLGKGMDTGGGLVLARRRLDLPVLRSRGKIGMVAALRNATLLKAVVALGLYSSVAYLADDYDSGPATRLDKGAIYPANLAILWDLKLQTFQNEVRLARERASTLGNIAPLAEYLRDRAIYFGSEGSHLRQLIRVRDPLRRDTLVGRLRKAGIDCAAAGEPLPDGMVGADGRNQFPNAARFRNDAVRLPFLGRLSAGRFHQFRTTLERIIVEHLS